MSDQHTPTSASIQIVERPDARDCVPWAYKKVIQASTISQAISVDARYRPNTDTDRRTPCFEGTRAAGQNQSSHSPSLTIQGPLRDTRLTLTRTGEKFLGLDVNFAFTVAHTLQIRLGEAGMDGSTMAGPRYRLFTYPGKRVNRPQRPLLAEKSAYNFSLEISS